MSDGLRQLRERLSVFFQESTTQQNKLSFLTKTGADHKHEFFKLVFPRLNKLVGCKYINYKNPRFIFNMLEFSFFFPKTASENKTGCKRFSGSLMVCSESVSILLDKPRQASTAAPLLPHELNLAGYLPVSLDPGKINVLSGVIFPTRTLDSGIIANTNNFSPEQAERRKARRKRKKKRKKDKKKKKEEEEKKKKEEEEKEDEEEEENKKDGKKKKKKKKKKKNDIQSTAHIPSQVEADNIVDHQRQRRARRNKRSRKRRHGNTKSKRRKQLSIF